MRLIILSFAEVDFSLFVLELPLPKRKAEVRVLLFVLGLPLPKRKVEVGVALSFKKHVVAKIEEPSRLLAIRFGTVTPNGNV